MDLLNFKLIICRRDYDNAESETSAIESQELELDINSAPDKTLPELELMKIFENDPVPLEIYQNTKVDDKTSWAFLKSKDPAKSYYCQVMTTLTN